MLFSRFSKVFPAFYFKFRCSSPADAADSAPAYTAEAIPAVNLHNTRAGEEHSPLFLIVFRPEADPPVHADCKIDVGFRVPGIQIAVVNPFRFRVVGQNNGMVGDVICLFIEGHLIGSAEIIGIILTVLSHIHRH